MSAAELSKVYNLSSPYLKCALMAFCGTLDEEPKVQVVLLVQNTADHDSDGNPFPPHKLYFWTDKRLGVRPDDRHGWWSRSGPFLKIWYNYQGKAEKVWAWVFYIRIPMSNCWMLASPYVQEKSCHGSTVLIPFEPSVSPTVPSEARASSAGSELEEGDEVRGLKRHLSAGVDPEDYDL